jgi:hypothetical protein
MFDFPGCLDNCNCNLSVDLFNGNTEPISVILPFCGMCNRNKNQDSRKKIRSAKNDSVVLREVCSYFIII